MLSFEVKDTDLAGRIGKISIAGRSFETPAYLPVVHPVRQEVNAEIIKQLGFKAIMTNSYIAMKKYPEGVDIHKQTKFDGVIMTDSGGYQALLYGKLEADPAQVAEYQSKIGTDIAVILDLPTGSSRDRAKAEKTVQETIAAAEKSLPFMKKPPAWLGPIQGGSFEDLVMYSAEKMQEYPFDIFGIGSPVEFMNNYRYRELVKIIVSAKMKLPKDKPVHLFGAGHPFTIPLAVALGCDTFDSASYILFAKEGKYMMQNGVRELKELHELPCSCRICRENTPDSLRKMPEDERTIMLAIHNLSVIKQEVDMVKVAIREGRLWNYMMMRLRSHPNLYSVLPFPKRALSLFEEGSRADKSKAFFFFDRFDIDSPEVRMHRRLVLKNFAKKRDSLIIIFSDGNFDSLFLKAEKLLEIADRLGSDIVLFHPFLSVVPVSIMGVYPLVQNVIPAYIEESVYDDSLNFLSRWVKLKRYKAIKLFISSKYAHSIKLRAFIDEMRKNMISIKTDSLGKMLGVH